MAHAIVMPSALKRTVQCSASLLLAMAFLNTPPDEATLEGDVGHWVAREYARGMNVAVGAQSPVPNGPLVDADMIKGALLWRQAINYDGYHPQGYDETPIPINILSEHCWGTPDRFEWHPERLLLRVYDYKYGHVFVDAFENWQCIAYAAGLLERLGMLGNPDVRIEIVIVQPRYFQREAVRVWRLTVGGLRSYINIARAAIEEAFGPNAMERTGPECLYCPRRHECGTLQRATHDLVHYVGRAEPYALGPDAIAVELELMNTAAALIKARTTGLEAQAVAMLKRGKRVGKFSLEPTEGRLNWTIDTALVLTILDAAQFDARKSQTPEVITPTQAIDRGADEKIIRAMSNRRPGEPRLVKDDGKKARQIFGGSKT